MELGLHRVVALGVGDGESELLHPLVVRHLRAKGAIRQQSSSAGATDPRREAGDQIPRQAGRTVDITRQLELDRRSQPSLLGRCGVGREVGGSQQKRGRSGMVAETARFGRSPIEDARGSLVPADGRPRNVVTALDRIGAGRSQTRVDLTAFVG